MRRLCNLYDNEINWSISTFWDAGFQWRLGDDLNGWKEEGNADCLEDAIGALHQAALKHYPESAYARAAGMPIKL